jgi:hypothetical protein
MKIRKDKFKARIYGRKPHDMTQQNSVEEVDHHESDDAESQNRTSQSSTKDVAISSASVDMQPALNIRSRTSEKFKNTISNLRKRQGKFNGTVSVIAPEHFNTNIEEQTENNRTKVDDDNVSNNIDMINDADEEDEDEEDDQTNDYYRLQHTIIGRNVAQKHLQRAQQDQAVMAYMKSVWDDDIEHKDVCDHSDSECEGDDDDDKDCVAREVVQSEADIHTDLCNMNLQHSVINDQTTSLPTSHLASQTNIANAETDSKIHQTDTHSTAITDNANDNQCCASHRHEGIDAMPINVVNLTYNDDLLDSLLFN